MSIFNDVLGLNRSSVTESVTGGFEPEVEEMNYESVEALEEGVDPLDFMLQVAYENEMNMKNLDMAIIAEEYICLRESGQEMVYEDTKIQSIIDKFKAGVKWLWENIQKFFKSVMAKIDDALKLDQRFLDKYEKKAAGKTAMVKGSRLLMDVDTLSQTGKDIIDDITTTSDMIFDDLTKDKATKYEDMNELYEMIGLPKDKSLSESVKKAFVKDLKDIKTLQSFKADEAIREFKKSKNVKQKFKEYYNENKKAINAQIKAAKKMERAARSHKVIPTETSKAIHGTVKVLNKLGSIMTIVNKTFVSVINMARSQYKAIIVAAATKDIKHESTSIIDSLEFGMGL